MNRRSVIARLHAVCNLIAQGGYPSTQTVAMELEVCPKTIQRDIDLLRDRLGHELVYDRNRHGWFYCTAPATLVQVTVKVKPLPDSQNVVATEGRHAKRYGLGPDCLKTQ